MSKKETARILIADTSENTSEAVMGLLEKQGYACLTQRIGKKSELPEALREQNWDVLLLNDEFSEFNAAECAEWISRLNCHTALLLLTQKDIQLSVLTRAYQMGIDGTVSLAAPDYLQAVFGRELDRSRDRRRCDRLSADNEELTERCRLLLSSSREAVAYIHQGMHIYANESYVKKFGFSDFDDVSSTPFIDMVSERSREALKNCLKDVENQWQTDQPGGSQKQQVSFDMVARKAEGTEFDAQLLLEPTYFAGEKCLQVFVSTEKENQKRLNQAVRMDMESGLFNRQFFLRQFDRLLQSIKKGQVSGGMLLYIRVNINDRIRSQIGLEQSEEEMRAFTGFLKQRMSRKHIVARFGDNDFIVLIGGDFRREPVKTDVESWQTALNAFKFKNLDRANSEAGTPSCRLISIGIDAQTRSIKDVLTLVYENLNESSQQQHVPPRRDRISAARSKTLSEMGSIKIELEDKAPDGRADQEEPPAAKQEASEARSESDADKNIDIGADELTQIINAGKLKLQYEVVIAVADIETEFNQVGIMLDEQRFSHIGSEDVYSLLDKHPSAPKFDRLVLDKTLQVMVDLYKQGQSQHFCVSICSASIRDPKFAGWLEAQLKKHNLDPATLTIKISQDSALGDVGNSIAFLNQLKEVGLKFCISQFSYSDAINNLLKKRRPDYIRLADSISSNITTDENCQTDIEELVGNLHDRNIKIIAGGVDDATTLSAYWVCNVDLVQGKYFQKESVDLNAASFSENNFMAMRNIA